MARDVNALINKCENAITQEEKTTENIQTTGYPIGLQLIRI